MEPGLPRRSVKPRRGPGSSPAGAAPRLDHFAWPIFPNGERSRAVLTCAASVLLAWALVTGAIAALSIARESGVRAFT
jgi:hypothetical protein